MADFPRIPFDEAIEALRRRGTNLFPSDHWATVWQEQHHREDHEPSAVRTD